MKFQSLKLSKEEKKTSKKASDNSRKDSRGKRNFFAHAGLSKSEVEVKVENRKIYIRYWQNKESQQKIRNWILKGLIELKD